MSLLVIAFPVIKAKDFEWIQSFRKANDLLYYQVVDPHFTFVFPVLDKAEQEFIQEIAMQAKDIPPINFEIVKAICHKDELQKGLYHQFLIPGKGNTEIIALHDKLYSGILAPGLRTDIPYIPHIGIGNSKNKDQCGQAVDELNTQPIDISGSIKNLTVVQYLNNKVTPLIEIQLG